jgi:hypothetical protein
VHVWRFVTVGCVEQEITEEVLRWNENNNPRGEESIAREESREDFNLGEMGAKNIVKTKTNDNVKTKTNASVQAGPKTNGLLNPATSQEKLNATSLNNSINTDSDKIVTPFGRSAIRAKRPIIPKQTPINYRLFSRSPVSESEPSSASSSKTSASSSPSLGLFSATTEKEMKSSSAEKKTNFQPSTGSSSSSSSSSNSSSSSSGGSSSSSASSSRDPHIEGGGVSSYKSWSQFGYRKGSEGDDASWDRKRREDSGRRRDSRGRRNDSRSKRNDSRSKRNDSRSRRERSRSRS